MNTNLVQHLSPEIVTQQIQQWNYVLLVAGGLVWHFALKIWPVVKSAFPSIQNYCDNRDGGLITGLFKFLFGKKKP